jgi:SAM-dependent methyltransferase
VQGMIREWVTLLRLACKRSHSYSDYQEFQIYQASLVLNYLRVHGICVKNTMVLDLGCGHGGYSYVLSRAGAHVISLDLRRPKTALPAFTQGDATKLPFADRSFSLVFCASLIEHVADPARLLAEVRRVLAPEGYVYLSFPPFYSPVGGHQFKPYHLLGERLALRLSRYKANGFATCFGDWGLYPLSIRRAQRLIKEAGLEVVHISTRFFPINFARLPWLGEFLTWHVQFILNKTEKPQSSSIFAQDNVRFLRS